MSHQPKRWPQVANRHRVNSIFKSGEIYKAAAQVLALLNQLDASIRNDNIALSIAIADAIRGETKFIKEASKTIQDTLENAPGANGARQDE